MKTIGDMQNEMYFYGHYNEIVYIHDYVKLMKHSYIYKTRIHSFIRVFILEYAYNYMTTYTLVYIHVYEWIFYVY